MNVTFNNAIWFSAAVMVVRSVGAVTTFILARLLTPGEYGTWLFLVVFVSYSSILCLGTVEALVKLLPPLVLRGKEAESRSIESGVLGSIVIAGTLLATVGMLAVWLMGRTAPISFLMIAAASCALFSAYFYHRFTAHQRFRIVSIIETVRAMTLLCLIIPFSLYWKLQGTATAFLLTELIVLSVSLLINRQILGMVTPLFSLNKISHLVSIGLPITLIWWTYMIQTSADRIISLSLLGKEAAGHFGLGGSIAAALVLVPMAIGRVLYPRITAEAGEHRDPEALVRLVVLPVRIMGLLLPLVIGVLFISIGDLYRFFFPAYLPGITAARIIFLSVYFIALMRNGVNFLVAIDRQNQVLVQVLVSLAVNVLTSMILVAAGFSIEGIAIGTMLSAIVLTTLLWKTTFSCMSFSPLEQLRRLVELALPIMLCTVLALPLLFIRRSTPAVSNVMACGMFLSLYLISIAAIPPLRRWCVEGISHLLFLTREGSGIVKAGRDKSGTMFAVDLTEVPSTSTRSQNVPHDHQ